MVGDPRARSLAHWRWVFLALSFSIVSLGRLPLGLAQAPLDEDEGGPPPPITESPITESPITESPLTEPSNAAVATPATASIPATRHAYIVAQPTDSSLFVDAQRAGAAALRALERFPELEWVAADRLFLGQTDEALDSLARARALLDSGRTAYLNLDFDRAVGALTEAVGAFDGAHSVLGSSEDLAWALLYLGASLVVEGREREAESVFARLHVQMPDAEPDPNVFNPEIVARFEAARARASELRSATIRVESDPPGAAVHVDFELRGATPLEVSGLAAGEHIVRVTRFGAIPLVERVTLDARASERVSAHFIPPPRMAPLPDALSALRTADLATDAARNAISTLAHSLEVDMIGLVRVAPARGREQVRIEFTLFDASGQSIARDGGLVSRARDAQEAGVEQLVVGVLEAGRQSLAETTRASLDVTSSSPSSAAPEEGSVIEEWWFWTIVGGVALAAGAGIGLGVALSEQPPAHRGHVILEF